MNEKETINPYPATRENERIISSEDLFQGTRTVSIDHQGNRYRLIITKQGKLVLNK